MQNWRRSGLGQVLVDALAALCDEKTVVMLSNEDLWSYHDQLLLQASRAGFEVRTVISPEVGCSSLGVSPDGGTRILQLQLRTCAHRTSVAEAGAGN